MKIFQKSSGVGSILVEDHFSPMHCYVISSTQKVYTKNDVPMHWREMDLGENWSYTSINFTPAKVLRTDDV